MDHYTSASSISCDMTKTALAGLPALQDRIVNLKQAGSQILGSISVEQVFNRGMRNVPVLVTDVSHVDSQEGLSFRGIPILFLSRSSVLELFWAGITGAFPDGGQVTNLALNLQKGFNKRENLDSVIAREETKDDPLSTLSQCYTLLSVRRQAGDRYFFSSHPDESLYLDALSDIKQAVAVIPYLIAKINQQLTGAGEETVNWERGWGYNLANALGVDPNLYASSLEVHGIVHIDQGKGNPSSHIAHIVASAGADPFRTVASSLLALSCPSHAYAGLGVLEMIDEILDQYGETPSDIQMIDYLIARLRNGKKIYGIGQAVMKRPDTRYIALVESAEKWLENSRYFQVAQRVLRVSQEVFLQHKKENIVANPNVNMIASIFLCDIMNVNRRMLPLLFSASRIIGNLCQFYESLIFPRAVYRPQSLTLSDLEEAAVLDSNLQAERPAKRNKKRNIPKPEKG